MAEIEPSKTCRTDGARSFGWQYAGGYLPEALSGSSLFHSGWSGQPVLFDLKSKRYAIVLTTRCGDYDRAKRERFAAIATILHGRRGTDAGILVERHDDTASASRFS